MSDLKAPTMDIYALHLATQTKAWNTYFYRTAHALADVLAAGYFNEAADNLVRPFDRFEVTAGTDGEPEFATLVVRSVTTKGGGKSVEVAKLGRR
ncbi:hypothetical protein [Bradyrhizobium diazoefficiens]|uniref:Uncharacterized protein n=1 Tax=Bradyrhizobium diazoefficiens TaxID=1355477 RepID=A0A809X5S8_9BRAD|nr:hypothetical protein XF1B_51810 [Bradyrhizobium diazoefficiens]BCE48764.1 hypothetical protein XF4B_51130 [Bradyrhizobium diazoefficiens]BCE92279.1 hypothetical protein XF10B_50770 [Bradyrhizobium diazoefficiens]BCF27207.1 hypothetical protein XF14B_51590 [Bradyrhizobium diazoefficiens]